jgi:hypothetical protein
MKIGFDRGHGRGQQPSAMGTGKTEESMPQGLKPAILWGAVRPEAEASGYLQAKEKTQAESLRE